MKGYKAFEKGMVCRGKQYAENTVFEEETAEVCKTGMHFCKNPLDVLEYYPLIDKNGDFSEFAEVEALDETKTDDGKKFCTKKLKIGAKLSVSDFIKGAFEITCENIRSEVNTETKNVKNYGDNATLAGGCNAKLAGGDNATLAGGYNATLAGGDNATLAGGDNATLAGGCNAKLAGGDNATLAGGDNATLAGGYNAKLAGGDYATLAGGDNAKLAGGESSVIVCGNGSKAKGGKNAVIVLTEWGFVGVSYVPVCVKAEIVDGEKIKPDTWYKLENGEFVEV